MSFSIINGGGGSDFYLNEQISKFKEKEKLIFLIYYRANRYFIDIIDKEGVEYYFVKNINQIKFIYALFEVEFFLNSLVSFGDFFALIEHIKKASLKLIMPIHDSFILCPSIHLINKDKNYCFIPSDKKVCDECFKQQNFNTHFKSIDAFRQAFQSLLDLASSILIFSNSSRQILEKVYQIDKNKYQLIPHQVSWIKRKCKKATRKKWLNIGILGHLALHKGSNIIQNLFKESLNLPWHFYYFGDFHSNEKYENLTLCGAYERCNLVSIIEERDIDIFIFPSICPETFSYTVEEIMLMDKPLICFNLGAQAERVSKYHKGYIADNMSVKALQDALRKFQNNDKND